MCTDPFGFGSGRQKKGYNAMIITDILARNARMYGDEIALIEREPAKNSRRILTWAEFDGMANRFARALMDRRVKKGAKVIHLMMNCLEWLPAYFGILRTGAWAVPLNFRFTAKDIGYCADIAEAGVLLFGEEFVDRINEIKTDLETIEHFIYLGPDEQKPDYAESFEDLIGGGSPEDPGIPLDLSFSFG